MSVCVCEREEAGGEEREKWQIYKYAQRYVSLARATAALRQYSNDSTAYNNIKFFEGNENPVVALLKDYYAVWDD